MKTLYTNLEKSKVKSNGLPWTKIYRFMAEEKLIRHHTEIIIKYLATKGKKLTLDGESTIFDNVKKHFNEREYLKRQEENNHHMPYNTFIRRAFIKAFNEIPRFPEYHYPQGEKIKWQKSKTIK